MGKQSDWLRNKLKRRNNAARATTEPSADQEEIWNQPLTGQLKADRSELQQAFQRASDVVFREFVIHDNGEKKDCLLIFIDGLVETAALQEHTLAPLLKPNPTGEARPELEAISIAQLSRAKTYGDAINAVLSGSAVLFSDGAPDAIIINVRGGTRRGVEEPHTEAAIRGPREGFTENLRTNTALLRFRIKSHYLKMEPLIIGRYSRTNLVLAYIEGIVDPAVLEEVRSRLHTIQIDGILETGYIEELIEDEPSSPFPQMQYTERPDTVAAQILEGRFAILVDGTPFVLTGPITFWQMLQASEDYYERFIIGNLIRWLRFLFLLIALYTPALYIAITTYHHEMLPTTLMLSIAAARESIPFPAVIEALLMEISFEALREAGVRLPRTIGQAVSILGALVIGQAAVEAGIVSAPMVIIVALTGIASFTIPRFNFAISFRMLRFPMMLLAGVFGLFGIVVGTVLLLVHLCSLRSFGVPYFSGVAPMKKKEQKDIFIRVPWWSMINRPSSFAGVNRQRMRKGMEPKPPQGGKS